MGLEMVVVLMVVKASTVMEHNYSLYITPPMSVNVLEYHLTHEKASSMEGTMVGP